MMKYDQVDALTQKFQYKDALHLMKFYAFSLLELSVRYFILRKK
jgi:hypothetical protein